MSADSSACCQARARLNLQTLGLISSQLAWNLARGVLEAERPLGKRCVKIVDGTTLSMPDTPENQAVRPQSSSQKPGLGFPVMKLVGLFSLESGALLESATGRLHDHEVTLFGSLWPKLKAADILLGDRGFCSYLSFAALRQRGIDSLTRLPQARRVDFRQGKRLGFVDRLVSWTKPAQRPDTWSEEEFAALPDTLAVRLIRLRVAASGFRTKTVVLATTLTDPAAYPADTLRALYGERWQVEGHFFQIKETLALDVLRCESPHMIEREVAIHQIAYNLVHALMQRSAHGSGAASLPPPARSQKSRTRSSKSCSQSSRATPCPSGPGAVSRAPANGDPKTTICSPAPDAKWVTSRAATVRQRNILKLPYLSAIRCWVGWVEVNSLLLGGSSSAMILDAFHDDCRWCLDRC